MAERPVVRTGPDENGIITFTWEQISNTDQTGAAIKLPSHPDKTVHFFGTFNGTIALQGSNQATPTVWTTVNDNVGDPLAVTGAAIAAVGENPLWLRPAQTIATLSDVDVILVCAPRNR